MKTRGDCILKNRVIIIAKTLLEGVRHATGNHDSRTALAIAAAISDGRRAAIPVGGTKATCVPQTSTALNSEQ